MVNLLARSMIKTIQAWTDGRHGRRSEGVPVG
jgi:hypothetical protein